MEKVDIFALLNKKVKFVIRDEREEILQQRYFHYPDGLKSKLSYWEINNYSKGKLKVYFQRKTESYEYEVALGYYIFGKAGITSYAGNQQTVRHGSLVSWVLKGLQKALTIFTKESLSNHYHYIAKNIKEDLHLVDSVKGDDLMYEGATKTRLGTPKVEEEIAQITFEEVYDYLMKNPN